MPFNVTASDKKRVRLVLSGDDETVLTNVSCFVANEAVAKAVEDLSNPGQWLISAIPQKTVTKKPLSTDIVLTDNVSGLTDTGTVTFVSSIATKVETVATEEDSE